MRILRINSLCGIKNQLYCPEQTIGGKSFSGISDGFFDINSLFWSKIFDPQYVQNLVQHAELELGQDQNPKVQAVLNAPDQFIASYQEALAVIDGTWTGRSEVDLFQAMETLEIICYLHSRLDSAPFVLTLPQGYIHSKYSALDMVTTCLLPFCNPYLNFIYEEIIPPILAYCPDILILTGKLNLPAFAIAKRIRKALPHAFIVSADTESDYFSMEKISNLLLRNSALFSAYHCVMLRCDAQAEHRLSQWKEDPTNVSLDNIPNLVYSIDGGNTIVKTADVPVLFQEPLQTNHYNGFVCNVKAFPQNHCYWNRCSFCGINSKYSHTCNMAWNANETIDRIKRLHSYGITDFWFLDEAIPAVALKCLAEQFTSNKLAIAWHVRTRIEPAFVSLAESLASAGLKHIIFGLESASNRVLTLMEKTSGEFDYIETAEQIVKAYTAAGIQVHFSTILGFPTETEKERHETTLFLTYLREQYTLFSYNINSFYLDIGSKIYRQWENYDIASLSFPCSPKYYLENYLDWNSAISPNHAAAIQRDKDLLMIQQYNWYPEDALIRPDIFYAFWEFGRFSLRKKPLSEQPEPLVINMDKIIAFSPMTSFCRLPSESWMIYQLKSHHFVVGGTLLHDLVVAAHNKVSFSVFLHEYKGSYKAKAVELISQLYGKGFFV